MGILKKISKGIEKAGRKYHEMERDSRPIRKAGMGVVDYIIPPPKKKGKGVTKKIGDCTCTCPKKKRR